MGLANHRTSIAIRRYPERFVRALASDTRERSHLLLLQHARKKTRDNYYGEYTSCLLLFSLSFPLLLLRAISHCLPILFYTLRFPQLPPFLSQLLLIALIFLSFFLCDTLHGQRVRASSEKFNIKEQDSIKIYSVRK